MPFASFHFAFRSISNEIATLNNSGDEERGGATNFEDCRYVILCYYSRVFRTGGHTVGMLCSFINGAATAGYVSVVFCLDG